MDYGSICSGVEAAGLAWEKLGWKAKFFAEVEPCPSAVLMHRFGATKPLRTLDPDSAESEKDGILLLFDAILELRFQLLIVLIQE